MDFDKIKQELTTGLIGAAAGAAALAVIGFNWGGWVTGSTAQGITAAAVLDELVPICVGQFNADPEMAMKLEEMNKTDFWQRAEYVTEHGWATMPGAKEADIDVARRCANKITS